MVTPERLRVDVSDTKVLNDNLGRGFSTGKKLIKTDVRMNPSGGR
jgi:hypothetical protein